MFLSGRVLNWNEKGFGWIKPTQTLTNLPGAHLNGGRVFIHRRDLIGCEVLEKDQDVRFLLYADQKGLGAYHCTSTKNIFFVVVVVAGFILADVPSFLFFSKLSFIEISFNPFFCKYS